MKTYQSWALRQYIKGKAHVLAEKRLRIPHRIAEKMLIASRREGDYLKALKWALTGTDVLVVSADDRNGNLIQILDCFDPVFSTTDTLEAAYFTAKLFPDVEVLMDEEPFAVQELEEEPSSNLANLVSKFKEGVHDGTLTNASDEGIQDDGRQSQITPNPQENVSFSSDAGEEKTG